MTCIKNGRMKLFDQERIPNLLPCDGIAEYFGKILSVGEASEYLNDLLRNIEWKNDEAVIFGKHLVTKRKVAWYGDAPFSYAYSNTVKRALPWTKELHALKMIVEKTSGETFNSCLLNLYHNGDEGMAWHSDDESSLKKNGAIASLSLGAARKFSFRHKRSGTTVSLLLENGSLLVMKEATQTHWLHCLPRSKRIEGPRINLTFRIMMV